MSQHSKHSHLTCVLVGEPDRQDTNHLREPRAPSKRAPET